MPKAKKRVPPNTLVQDAANASRSWLQQLSLGERLYLRQVVAAMRSVHDATPNAVAIALIRELGLSVSRYTVANTIRELLNAKA